MATQSSSGSNGYKGVERRKKPRREKSDRRVEIRWEPAKTNRRQNAGRRATDILGSNSFKR